MIPTKSIIDNNSNKDSDSSKNKEILLEISGELKNENIASFILSPLTSPNNLFLSEISYPSLILCIFLLHHFCKCLVFEGKYNH